MLITRVNYCMSFRGLPEDEKNDDNAVKQQTTASRLDLKNHQRLTILVRFGVGISSRTRDNAGFRVLHFGIRASRSNTFSPTLSQTLSRPQRHSPDQPLTACVVDAATTTGLPLILRPQPDPHRSEIDHC
ncbi:hypothetical protein GQ457_06G007240 [Hibiscus cannabinus]